MFRKRSYKKIKQFVSVLLLTLFLGCPTLCVGDSLFSLVSEQIASTSSHSCHTESTSSEQDTKPLASHCGGDSAESLSICNIEKIEPRSDINLSNFNLDLSLSGSLTNTTVLEPSIHVSPISGHSKYFIQQDFYILAYSAHAPPIS
jgi:hypothetical protein